MLLHQWGVPQCWSAKFIEQGRKTFKNVTIFQYLAETLPENYLIFY